MGQAEYQAACQIVRALKCADHEAVLAGGCVRDRLLGIVPKDYDVATSATPEQVKAVFPGSKGVGEAFFVEQDRRVANLLQENIESMDCADRAEVLRADAFSPLVRLRLGQDCDIVSLDPPYAMMQEEETLAKVLEAAVGYASCLRPGGWFVLRTPEDPEHTPHDIDGLLGPEVHAYGRDMFVLLYQRPPEANDGAG